MGRNNSVRDAATSGKGLRTRAGEQRNATMGSAAARVAGSHARGGSARNPPPPSGSASRKTTLRGGGGGRGGALSPAARLAQRLEAQLRLAERYPTLAAVASPEKSGAGAGGVSGGGGPITHYGEESEENEGVEEEEGGRYYGDGDDGGSFTFASMPPGPAGGGPREYWDEFDDDKYRGEYWEFE
jgi:hypothetical protein